MQPVNWTQIFTENQNAVEEFAARNITFRNFQRRFSGTARQEVNKLQRQHEPNNRRNLARRALQRRHAV